MRNVIGRKRVGGVYQWGQLLPLFKGQGLGGKKIHQQSY